jgi:hypothetical protein
MIGWPGTEARHRKRPLWGVAPQAAVRPMTVTGDEMAAKLKSPLIPRAPRTVLGAYDRRRARERAKDAAERPAEPSRTGPPLAAMGQRRILGSRPTK